MTPLANFSWTSSRAVVSETTMREAACDPTDAKSIFEVCPMTNLILHYLHRDEGNWKDRFEVCILNPAGHTAEQMIRECLIDREFFYPEKVGLSFSIATDWHELDCVEADQEGTAPLTVTLETLLDNLKEFNKVDLQPIKVHKVPVGISIRLAVSWLEFLREMRQVLDVITALLRKDSVVMVFKSDGDWRIVEETLRLDSQSGNFDRDLRHDIERALDGAKEICDLRPSINLIRRKSGNIQKRIEKMIHRGM
jgi:hypothetical protein